MEEGLASLRNLTEFSLHYGLILAVNPYYMSSQVSAAFSNVKTLGNLIYS